jgi:Divergent InlB B-repeat domain
MMMRRLSSLVSLVLLIAVSMGMSTAANAAGDPNEGRVRYLANCSGCHGVPPDHRAIQAANDPDFLFLTINYVGRMGFLATRLNMTDIENITAYLGDKQLNQNVVGVGVLGNGAGAITSNPAGLSCGVRCAWNFAPNTEIILRAEPQRGSRFAGWSGACSGTGLGECRLTTDQAKSAFATFDRNGPVADYSDLWWGGATENGWGLSINHSDTTGQLVNILFVYDARGEPTWYATQGGAWSENFTVYRAPVFKPKGAPLNRYNVSSLQPGTALGEIALRFLPTGALEMSYTIEGISGVKPLTRQPGDPLATVRPFNIADLWRPACRLCRDNRAPAPLRADDLWWAGINEEGWGLTFAQQRVTLFGLWYSFDTQGRPTWFVMPTGAWFDRRYTSVLYKSSGSVWLNQPYDASRLVVAPVGRVQFDFATNGSTVMTYFFDAGEFAGTEQTKTLTRRAY